MNDWYKTRSAWRGHLTRCIAVFFVLFTFADLAFSHCIQYDLSEGAGSVSVAQSTIATDRAAAALRSSDLRAADTHHDQSSESPCNDECCFCCARVLLGGSAAVRVPVPESRTALTARRHDSPLTPFLSGTFRPPRLV